MRNLKSQNGYTFIELLVVVAILGIMFGLAAINLLNAQQTTSLKTAEETLIADMKNQQLKAMNGIDNSGSFGIHFPVPGNNTYVLFQGNTYDPLSSGNYTVSINGPISINGTDIVFNKVSGEIYGYTNPVDITVKNTNDSSQKVIELNQYGVIVKE